MFARRPTGCTWLAGFVCLSLVFSGCTKDDEPPQALAPLPPGPPAERPDPFLKSPARFGTLRLHAGFNPDPRVVQGVALGEMEATSLRKRCRGWVSKKPDYLLAAETAFLQLYLIGRARGTVSIVLRKPDGTVECRNARKGTADTVLETDLPLGTSQLWVGVPTEGASLEYRLGVSEVSWRSSKIPLPD